MVRTGYVERGLLAIGWVCNLRCKHCYYHSYPKRWKHPLWILGWLVLTRLCHMKKVDISGGEPLLYPRLDLLIRVCKLLGYKEIRFSTNATQMETAERISKEPKVMFMTSFHSHARQDIIDFMGADVLDRIVEFHRRFKDRITYVNLCFTPYHSDIENTLTKVRELSGCKRILLKFLEYNWKHTCEYETLKDGVKINESIRRLFKNYPDTILDVLCYPMCLIDEDNRQSDQYNYCPSGFNLNPHHPNAVIARETPLWRWILYILGINRRGIEYASQRDNWRLRGFARTPRCEGCVCIDCPGPKTDYTAKYGDARLSPIGKCPRFKNKQHCSA